MIEFVLLLLLQANRDLVAQPQSQIEMLFVEWAATQIDYDKAPMDAMVTLEPVPLEVTSSDEPVKVSTAIFTERLNHYLEVQLQPRQEMRSITASLTGVWVTFNPQFQIGKNTFSWTADTCNYTTDSLTYDGAMISQIGEMTGNLSRVSPTEAEGEATAWRNKTLPVQGVDGLTVAGHWLTIIGAAGVFAISPHGIAVMALATKLSEDFSGWLKTKEPLSFLQRFPINTWLTGPMLLAPRSCIQDRVLFSRRVKSAHTFSAQLP